MGIQRQGTHRHGFTGFRQEVDAPKRDAVERCGELSHAWQPSNKPMSTPTAGVPASS